MTSFIAGCGSGRSVSFIPAVPAAWSVTMIAFIDFIYAVTMLDCRSPFEFCGGRCRNRLRTDRCRFA
jgi:hypothetical protein